MIFMGMSIALKVWRWKSRVSCCSTMGSEDGRVSLAIPDSPKERKKGFYHWSKSGVPSEEPEFLPKKPNYWNFFSQDMSSNVEVVEFTTGDSEPIVCQRCLQSFEAGTELYFMHDSKPDRGVKESALAAVSTISERQRLARSSLLQVCLSLPWTICT